MPPYELKLPYAAGESGRTAALLVAGTLVLSGIFTSFSRASLTPLLFSFAGICLYCWLLYQHPQYEYFIALRIDEQGIEYARAPTPLSPKTVLRWPEVKSVSSRLISKGEDAQGIEVVSLKYGDKGVLLFLPFGTELECRAASKAAEYFRAAYFNSAA